MKTFLIVLLCNFIVILFGVVGFKAFFVNFGVAPIDTISQLIGILIVPMVPAYFLAITLRKLFSFPLLPSWTFTSLVITLLVVLSKNGFSLG